MAVCQLLIYQLTHRHREQAPSHIIYCVRLRYQAISATTAANALAGSAAWLIGRPITR